MTFVLLLLAAWLVLNIALLGAAAGLDRRRLARETRARPSARVFRLGAR